MNGAVSTVHTPEGIVIISIKKGVPYRKLLSWKELYRMGLKGKRMTGPAVVKEVAKKVEELVKGNLESASNHKKFMADMKSLEKHPARVVPAPYPAMVMPPPRFQPARAVPVPVPQAGGEPSPELPAGAAP